jgi:hypothetical protein
MVAEFHSEKAWSKSLLRIILRPKVLDKTPPQEIENSKEIDKGKIWGQHF